MIDILATTQVLLRESGYFTRLLSFEKGPLLCFEDDTIMGFCRVFDTPEAMLKDWKQIETALLLRYGSRFRSAGEKAWNIYCVFLSSAPANSVHAREVRWIEENLERTRKVASCNLSTREEIQRALLPLLRLQYRPTMQLDGVTDRLRRRIAMIAPNAADVSLDENVAPIEVIRLLGGAS